MVDTSLYHRWTYYYLRSNSCLHTLWEITLRNRRQQNSHKTLWHPRRYGLHYRLYHLRCHRWTRRTRISLKNYRCRPKCRPHIRTRRYRRLRYRRSKPNGWRRWRYHCNRRCSDNYGPEKLLHHRKLQCILATSIRRRPTRYPRFL